VQGKNKATNLSWRDNLIASSASRCKYPLPKTRGLRREKNKLSLDKAFSKKLTPVTPFLKKKNARVS